VSSNKFGSGSHYAYAFPDDRVAVRGHLELERTGRGVRPVRLPVWTRGQHHEALMEWDANATAGIRLVFATRATAIRLEVLCTRLQLGTMFFPAVFELITDAAFVARSSATGGDLFRLDDVGSPAHIAGGADFVEFSGLPAGEKVVQIWLPHSAGCELIQLSADAAVEPTTSAAPTWLHHGSSISHCLEVENPRDTWPTIAAELAGVDCVNLGFAGNAVLDPFVARSIRDASADVISLKLGINVLLGKLMKPRVFTPAVHGFLDTVRDGHPDTPIVLVSPIACPQLESAADAPTEADGQLTIGMVREQLAAIVAQRADPHLHYLDGRALLDLDSADDIPDGVHPNAAGYRLMGERFAVQLASMLTAGAPRG
jgi:lysophospholipase L1-like esterase